MNSAALPSPATDAGTLVLSGLYCSACAGLIEDALRREPGVLDASVAAATRRARVRWDPTRTSAQRLVAAVQAAGYGAVPDGGAPAQQLRRDEQRSLLWRLFVAGFCAMQVMMLATPAYVAAPGELDAGMLALLEWGSWVLTLPVLGFAVGPFVRSAFGALRQRRISMDVPVVLGIVVTFVASTVAMVAAEPGHEVYFDSLTMFVAFLWFGRWLEMRARHRAAGALEGVAAELPDAALRVNADGSVQPVSRVDLRPGDRVRVPRGAALPADGQLHAGTARVSEALLTGESAPVDKAAGAEMLAGSLNLGDPFEMQVRRVGADTRVAAMRQLMEQALHERPAATRWADRIAGPFLWAVLLLAAASAAAWSLVDPARAVWVGVAVLIVTCPCALALATPATLVAAASGLARRGVLLARLRALEALPRVTQVFIDKTGTLTDDKLALRTTHLHHVAAPLLTEAAALHWAASLARWSSHPLSLALVDAAGDAGKPPPWTDVEEVPGHGLQGRDAAGRLWRLGSPTWLGVQATGEVVLACGQTVVASFDFGERLRPGARDAIQALRRAGLRVTLLSGDRAARAHSLAAEAGIDDVIAPATPEQKLAAVRAAQAGGACVAMIGDGLNDAPVLAAADVSLAMGHAALAAQQGADAIIASGRLDAFATARASARKAQAVLRQNLAWALAYNAACVPLAALGFLPPWAAGLGMAASSLLVILNAQRAARAA